METGLAGKRVLITGGGIGIGRGIAVAFGREGARVALTYLTHRPDKALQAACPGVIPIHLDATDPTAVATAVADAADTLGGIDVLVNNVGGMVARTSVATMSTEHWHEVMDANVTSMFLVTKAVLPHLADEGRIINISSVAAHNGGGDGAVAYATAKAAMIGFTRGLAKELAPRHVTVNAIAPGLILDTPFHAIHTSAPSLEAMVDAQPLGRPGYPADVAGATIWLASDAGGWVSGTVVDVNGGTYFA